LFSSDPGLFPENKKISPLPTSRWLREDYTYFSKIGQLKFLKESVSLQSYNPEDGSSILNKSAQVSQD
jgi:hypothetical protein